MCAQTTGGMSWVDAVVFVSADDTTWVDISGQGASVAVSGGERATGEQNTMDGDTPIVKSGKRSSLDLTCRFVYSETAGEAFEVLRVQYETEKGPIYVQYSPVEPGGFWFTTGLGIMTSLLYPGGDAGSGDVVMSEFVTKCASITKATASS